MSDVATPVAAAAAGPTSGPTTAVAGVPPAGEEFTALLAAALGQAAAAVVPAPPAEGDGTATAGAVAPPIAPPEVDVTADEERVAGILAASGHVAAAVVEAAPRPSAVDDPAPSPAVTVEAGGVASARSGAHPDAVTVAASTDVRPVTEPAGGIPAPLAATPADAGRPSLLGDVTDDAPRGVAVADAVPEPTGTTTTTTAASAAPTSPEGAGGRAAPAEPGSAVARMVGRVMDALDVLENAPPPRRLTIDLPDIDGLRLHVTLRGSEVHVSVLAGGSGADVSAWGRELTSSLAARGFSLGGFDGGASDGRPRRGQDLQHPDAPPAPAHSRGRGRPSPADDGLRL